MDFASLCFDIYPISDHGSEQCILESTACSIQEYISPQNFLEMETDVLNFLEMDFTDSQMEEAKKLKDIQDELMMEESSLTDVLIMGAEAVDSGDAGFVSIIATRLKEILSGEVTGDNMLDRLAIYFTEGLLNRIMNAAPADPVLETNAIPAAFQMLQQLSPYVKFSHFTANQAILEATEGQFGEIHVLDFDIREGIQWPSLMVDLASFRKDASLRITAIVGHEMSSSRTQQTGLRLREFADSINLSFSFDQILIIKEEDFGDIRVGHSLIANCKINQLHMPVTRGSRLVKTFFDGLRKLCPKLVVLVQEELFNFSKVPFMPFAEFFCEALDHYTALSDSLCSGFSGGYKFASRVIEREFLRMRILDSVQNFGCESPFSMAGFRPIPASSCNVTQAKHLVSLFNGGYWVKNEKCGLTLCWKSRPLTTASIWVPAVSSRLNN